MSLKVLDDFLESGDNTNFLRKIIEKLRNATIGESQIPDVKSRLIATGLIDRMANDVPIPLPVSQSTQEPEQYNNNNHVQEPGFVIVGSDVSALYPSLDPEVSARICYEEVLRSELEFMSFKSEEV